MPYEPQPIDTSKIRLHGDLHDLTEQLAENAHDHWARLRMSEGWTYGPQRNDESKQHPCLVPYSELPESEKEYDRQTAIETLRAILALGFRIGRAAGEDDTTV
jgi:hypothetical protein